MSLQNSFKCPRNIPFLTVHCVVKVKSCYNLLRLGTVIVLVSSGIDFVNTPRLYSDQATRKERLPTWPYGLCQREPKMPGLYKKHTATQPIMPEMRLEPLNICLTDRRLNQLSQRDSPLCSKGKVVL